MGGKELLPVGSDTRIVQITIPTTAAIVSTLIPASEYPDNKGPGDVYTMILQSENGAIQYAHAGGTVFKTLDQGEEKECAVSSSPLRYSVKSDSEIVGTAELLF